MTSQLEVSNFLTPLISLFKKGGDEWDNFFENGLSDYLQSQTEKYYFTNTFIHRSDKIRFTSIYFPVSATYKRLTTDFYSLEEVLDEYKNVTLVGSAGSGKTTLVKHIFLRAVALGKRIPILIELRNLNEYEGDLEKLISEKVLKSRISPSDSIFRRTLKTGRFLFLFDGYDEIFSSKKQEINRQIEQFIDTYYENRFIVTTRPGSGIEGFSRFFDFQVKALSDPDVEGFIRKVVNEKEREERIIDTVKSPENRGYLHFLRNPLLLSMFIMTFENHPEIPKRKSALYRNVFDTLYSKHDGITKNSFPREKLTKLQREDFEHILSVFSYVNLITGQYDFTEEYLVDCLRKITKQLRYDVDLSHLVYDLHTSISMLVLDGLEYNFPHRSMQEYLTAVFVSRLPSEKKEAAYSKLSNALEKSSEDFSFTFWRLCNEMDRVMFLIHFIIPQLEKLYKALPSDKADSETLRNFFAIVGLRILVTERPKTEVPDPKRRIMVVRRFNFIGALSNFCNLPVYVDFSRFLRTEGVSLELEEYYQEKRKVANSHQDRPKSTDPEVAEILLRHGVIDVIKGVTHKINNKILEWKKEAEDSKISIDEILEL